RRAVLESGLARSVSEGVYDPDSQLEDWVNVIGAIDEAALTTDMVDPYLALLVTGDVSDPPQRQLEEDISRTMVGITVWEFFDVACRRDFADVCRVPDELLGQAQHPSAGLRPLPEVLADNGAYDRLVGAVGDIETRAFGARAAIGRLIEVAEGITD
ncbi:MAG: hypothetical protein ACRD0U_18685, partial [Acidimicrobiales bacterium]